MGPGAPRLGNPGSAIDNEKVLTVSRFPDMRRKGRRMFLRPVGGAAPEKSVR
jgi:hypothetical protein